jgi:hypothetical protein
VSAEFHGSGQQQLLQKVTAPGGSEEVDQTPACEEVYMQQQPSAAGIKSLVQGQQTQATAFSSVEQNQQTMPRKFSRSLQVKEISAVGSLFHQQPESSCQLVEQNFSIR